VSYLKRILLSIDQLGNTLLGGKEDETISSRVGRGKLKKKKLAKVASKVIDAGFGKDHCVEAIEWDEVKPPPPGDV
jgi:hypothetical protein